MSAVSAAARVRLETEPPGWARASADLLLATTCAARRDALRRIAAAGDIRAAPFVEQLRAEAASESRP